MSFLSRFVPLATATSRAAVRFASTGRYYTKKHEWISVNNKIGTVGITDFAAEHLGDVVYVDLPEAGTQIEKGETAGAVESVKAASDIYSPVSGTVVESNEKLADEPGVINKSPFEKGWMYKLEVSSDVELGELLTEEQYTKFKEEESGEEH